jgi:hypothetical protein
MLRWQLRWSLRCLPSGKVYQVSSMCSTIAGASIESHQRKHGGLEPPQWVLALEKELVDPNDESSHLPFGCMVESQIANTYRSWND